MSKQLSDDIFGNFFLSEKDNDLLASGSRDPLGFESMWVHVAHRVIPGLNTQSIGARNFAVVWLLHWIVDRWLQNRSPGELEGVDLERLRKHCLLVAETTYVLSVREQFDLPNGRDVDLRHLYGRGGALKAWNEKRTNAEISPRTEHQILRGQDGNGHIGRYDAPLRIFGIIRETASASDGARVLRTAPLERFKEEVWFQGVEKSLRPWFDRLLKEEEPTFTLGDFEARPELTRLRDWDTLAILDEELCGPEGLAVESGTGEASETSQAFVWQQLPVGNTDAQTAYGRALEAAQGADSRAHLYQAQTLEHFLAHVEAFFDVGWQTNVATATVKGAFQNFQNWTDDNSTTLSAIHHELQDLRASTGAQRLGRLRKAVTGHAGHLDFQKWLVDEYHKPMMVEERKNNPWLAFEGDEVRVLNGGYAPANPFADGNIKRWRKRNYYLGTLETFHKDIMEARKRSDQLG